MKPMRLLIAGGGTGGHVFPGLAVAEALLERDPSAQIRFVGTRRGVEARAVPRAGYPLSFIHAAGLKRVGLWKTLVSLVLLPWSLVESLWVLLRFRPDVVVGTGGFVSGAPLLMARVLFRKTLIVEPNHFAGTANRLLGKIVHRVVVNFEDSVKTFPAGKAVALGNPVRKDLVEKLFRVTERPVDPERFNLFVFGGSQGAHALNVTLAKALPNVVAKMPGLSVHHQTGQADVDLVREAYEKGGVHATVEAFVDDMVAAYERADMVICRAGVGSCAEVAIARRPALFVPLPTAADNHQYFNAKAFADREAGWLVEQNEFTPDYAEAFVRERMADREGLRKTGMKAGDLAKPDAAKGIVDEIMTLARRN